MTKKVDAWMPLVVDKYLGDTTHLTTEQHGAYLLLLMAMWKKGGRLHDVDAQLAQIVRLPAARWKQAIRPILVDDCLLKSDGCWLTQKRLAAELERAQKHSAAKAEAGSKGAAKRWQKDGTAIAQPLADASQDPSQMGAPIPIPSPKHPSDAPENFATPDGVASADEGNGEADSSNASSSHRAPPPCPHLAILSLWGERLPQLPQPRVDLWGGDRADHLRTRWRETAERKKWVDQAEGLAFFARLFDYIRTRCSFLLGHGRPREGSRAFKADLGWVVVRANWVKILEGKYEDDEIREEVSA